MTLERVRGAARFESASAKDARTAAANVIRRGHQLKLGLNRARPSHGDEVAATYREIQHRHKGVLT
jgi:hypothetical protein